MSNIKIKKYSPNHRFTSGELYLNASSFGRKKTYFYFQLQMPLTEKDAMLSATHPLTYVILKVTHKTK